MHSQNSASQNSTRTRHKQQHHIKVLLGTNAPENLHKPTTEPSDWWKGVLQGVPRFLAPWEAEHYQA